ncbi:MAG: ATP-binding protein [Burkholderiaceae bacterium]
MPNALAESAEAAALGRTHYQQLIDSRLGLKRLFRITLTLIFFLTAFAAIAAAFLLSGWLTGPLSMLAAGTRAVAEGDFRPVKDYSGRDELGVLTQSFNAMTHQLQEARLLVESNQRELEQVNARLESVLSNLTAGVLVLDADFRLTLANAGAERIVGLSLVEYLYEPVGDVPRLGQLAAQIRGAFNDQVSQGAASWQRQFSLHSDAGPGTEQDRVGTGHGAPRPSEQTILARGSILPEQRVGYVIVFDDITSLISAQRAVAWAEVARRLAHEIMNPLTPIQLSAERMRLKLADKLPPGDAALLEKSAATIINQVAALKLMVDEFREYARLPAAQLVPLDLNGLIEDVAALYSAGGGESIVHTRLDAGLPQVLGDRTQLRQLVHNLVKNATEATGQIDDARVDVITEAVALPTGRRGVRLRVLDNGHGFSPDVLGRVFEPYVTTKSRGTGLGLAIVKKIVDEHGARIDASNANETGARGALVSVLFTKLAESDDNSEPDETATQRV